VGVGVTVSVMVGALVAVRIGTGVGDMVSVGFGDGGFDGVGVPVGWGVDVMASEATAVGETSGALALFKMESSHDTSTIPNVNRKTARKEPECVLLILTNINHPSLRGSLWMQRHFCQFCVPLR
jgi:hypothetical protein